ncbi:MAG: T9SS type A sorting domain-containing protein [Saprospiraceae bacterium]
MKYKLILILLLAFSIYENLISQCIPPHSQTCEDAPILNHPMEINGLICRMIAFSNPTAFLPCRDSSTGVPHNTVWYKFQGNEGLFTFTINVSNCERSDDGLQVGLVEECFENRPVFCSGICTEKSITFAANLECDKVYSLFLDGCSGAVCDYQIQVKGSGKSCKKIPYSAFVFDDENSNCIYDSGEEKEYDIVVLDSFNNKIVTRGNRSFYLIREQNYGKHYFKIDYRNPYVTVCSDWILVDLDSTTTDINLEYGRKIFLKCPLMNVDVSLNSVPRFCEVWNYKIQYSNTGTEAASNASVVLKLDPHLQFLSSSKTPDRIELPYIYYNLGDINIFESGQFTLNVKNDCINAKLGMTHCIDAHIYPDSICNPSSLWNGASIKLSSQCDKDKVIFDIWNSGDGDMEEKSQYFIVEDDILPMQSSDFQLNRNQHLIIERPSNGKTYRMFVNQVKNHPGFSSPTLAVEYCQYQQNPSVLMSLGYVNMFKEDDEDLFVDKQCNESVTSYDPNDKTGTPKGYGINSIIDRSDKIEYLIRFQNTGKDTAFQVILKDQLDDKLNLTTFEMVSASSPNFSFTIEDRLLEVKFLNILLPPQRLDEFGSQGYFKFRIKPNENALLGSKIHNEAEIYFDYNSPIVTQKVTHQIAKNIISVDVKPFEKASEYMEIIPNPNQGIFLIKLHEKYNHADLKILNQMGQTVYAAKQIKNNYLINNAHLSEGLYYIELTKATLPKLVSKFVLLKLE